MRRFSVQVQRATVVFVAGLAGMAHQTLIEGADRPTLLIIYAGMLGLPAFLRGDEKTHASKPPEPPP